MQRKSFVTEVSVTELIIICFLTSQLATAEVPQEGRIPSVEKHCFKELLGFQLILLGLKD
jgi:hypothetical protein